MAKILNSEFQIYLGRAKVAPLTTPIDDSEYNWYKLCDVENMSIANSNEEISGFDACGAYSVIVNTSQTLSISAKQSDSVVSKHLQNMLLSNKVKQWQGQIIRIQKSGSESDFDIIRKGTIKFSNSFGSLNELSALDFDITFEGAALRNKWNGTDLETFDANALDV